MNVPACGVIVGMSVTFPAVCPTTGCYSRWDPGVEPQGDINPLVMVVFRSRALM